ncbi:MAG: MFS transporter, partial [Defluviitaleaceae bacterium]|nr:MFS transporter [Defluviitaleaceae bacterium]
GPIFDLVHISGLLAVLFAPFAGFFVANYGVVPVVRTIYIIAFIVMNLKFVLTYIFTYETEKGKQKMAETKDVRISKLLYSYKDVIKKIFKSRPMIRALSLQTSINIINVVISTFFALYITQNLEIGNEFLAFFPIISAVIQMIFLFFVQQRLNKFKSRNIMFGGILLYIIAILSLMLSPAQNLFFIGTYVLLQATANGLLQPRIQAINAAAIDPNDRARIRSIFMALSLGVTAPFGIIAGNLSELDRRFPFLLIIALLLFMIFQNVKRK